MGTMCMLRSPTRAARKPPISTVMLPIAIPFGSGETHTIPPGMLLATAAGIPPISTVGTAAAGVIGPPTCGLGPSDSRQAAMSPARRAGPVGINSPPSSRVPSMVAATTRARLVTSGRKWLHVRAACAATDGGPVLS